MKKFSALFSLVVFLAAASFGVDANQMHYITIAPANDSGLVTNTGINVSAYKGNATVVVMSGASSIPTNAVTVTIQHSSTVGGTYTVLTNLQGVAGVISHTGTNAALDEWAIDLSRASAFIRTIVAQVNDTNAVSAVLVAPSKSE